MDSLAANPLHLRPCLGFYRLQLLLFSNVFWSDVWQDYVSWKQIDMDYLRNTDKQRRLVKFGTIAPFSRWKSYLNNGTWLLFSFLITKKPVVCVIWNEPCRPAYVRINGSTYNLRGRLDGGRKISRGRNNCTWGFHAGMSVRVVPKYWRFEKEIKMPGDKNKHAIWALLLSLLALTTIFQQNYHNNQLVVTPNEMVGLYCRD